jgi:hypothetical protein
MTGAILALLLSGGTYLSLAMLPKGRPAAVGIGAAVALAVIYRLVTGDAGLSALAGMGIAMAAVAQALRVVLLPRLPGWSYPALVPLLALCALAILLR